MGWRAWRRPGIAAAALALRRSGITRGAQRFVITAHEARLHGRHGSRPMRRQAAVAIHRPRHTPCQWCELIQRAAHGATGHAQDMGVDHGRADIGMAEQFLHRADVVAGLQQMRGKRMAQRVWRGWLVHRAGRHRTLEGCLERTFKQMMAAAHRAARVDRGFGLREDPEPGPGQRRTRVLAC